MQGPHVLLSYYVARIIRGPVQFCHPSWVVSLVLQNLIGASWSSSGHTKCVFLLWDALFILASCLGWALWGIPCYVFSWLSFLEQGWGVLCFRHRFCGEDSGPSLAPRFAGFTVLAQPTQDNRNGRLLYPVRAVRYYLVRLGCASSAMRAVPFCRRV